MSMIPSRFLREGRQLPPELEEARVEIEALAKRVWPRFFRDHF